MGLKGKAHIFQAMGDQNVGGKFCIYNVYILRILQYILLHFLPLSNPSQVQSECNFFLGNGLNPLVILNTTLASRIDSVSAALT